MKDSTFHICPCYRCQNDDAKMIWPSSPEGYTINGFVVEGMVTCFWGYSWESLTPSPTQRTGMKKLLDKMSSLLFNLISHVQRHNSFAHQIFLAFVITYCTGQIVPFDVSFGLHSCAKCNGSGSARKKLSERLLRHEDMKLLSLPNRSSLVLWWQQQVALAISGVSGHICWLWSRCDISQCPDLC